METKSWLEVEMDETVALLRKRLEKLNGTEPEDVDEHIVCEIEHIYRALQHIQELRKS